MSSRRTAHKVYLYLDNSGQIFAQAVLLACCMTFLQTRTGCGTGSESNLTSWLDGGSKASLALQQHNTAVAGELIGVEVHMSNPMAIGLSLTQLRAVYEHESGATGPVNAFVKVGLTTYTPPVDLL